MIEKIIEFSVRNRYLVLCLTAVLTVVSVHAVVNTPVDAIPDLSENQVIVFTDWMGRSPQEIEDQVTYPLSLKLQGLAGVKSVRSTSEFNYSMIMIIFEDNIDFYFARERVLERLTLASTFLPEGAVPYLAPDATAVGQIFWYTLEGGSLDPGRMWALQKYYVGPELSSVPGVAEVGMAGGAPREYQIDVDPTALRAYGVGLGDLFKAVNGSNSTVGGRVIQKANAEYLVRSIGWVGNLRDIENTVIAERNGVPIYVKNVAAVQIGAGFRRSSYEKDGNEVVGGVVIMRFGENPLAVTDRIKKKIQELQPGLPEGARIVPAYERSQLIHGAIDSLVEVMWHEMLIAALAILLILLHVRSALVICVTLPLAVLFSFLMMAVLRRLGIVDIQANIMSLAGITISIGILVDQAIVMVENATHHLKEHFGDSRVTGDTRTIVLAACRTVGRPIFFSVLIILLSFVPVFALSGREGKYFHPMAFTKSLAMVGVALISVTVVPALIPTFIKGKLKGEEQNWIVRSLIHIYKPLLEWALDRRVFVMWAFAALLILAAGLFPLQALFGLGAAHYYWKIFFFGTTALVVGIVAIVFIFDFHREVRELAGNPRSRPRQKTFANSMAAKVLTIGSLVILARVAYDFPKIGVEDMPPLDELTLMYMPVTVPRASITQVADDLKVQDALLRGFPEVESVIGKAGRADTPTDPSPLDMVETYVNFRPRELWPKRVLKFNDASWQTRQVLAALEQAGYILQAPHADDRDALINDVAMTSLTRFDETMRLLALELYRDFEQSLASILTRFAVNETLRRFDEAGDVSWPKEIDRDKEIDRLAQSLETKFGRWLARNPALEDVTRLTQAVAQHFADLQGFRKNVTAAEALALKENIAQGALSQVAEALGAGRKTFAGEVLGAVTRRRNELWRSKVHDDINWRLFDRAVEAFTWLVMTELGSDGKKRGLITGAPHGAEFDQFLHEEKRGAQSVERGAPEPERSALGAPRSARRDSLSALLPALHSRFASRLFLWRREGGMRGDLKQEMETVLQLPGWSNIFTHPIANRIDMLSTGVRTPIGIKVYGPDLPTIDRASNDIKRAVENVDGAGSVVAEQIMGEGYLEIKIDRQRAARYGINVGDIQDTIDIALGGKIITWTVEGRDRFPVRVRYARDFREDEDQVKRLLVTAMRGDRGGMKGEDDTASSFLALPPSPAAPHRVAPGHSLGDTGALQIPLSEVADIRIVEGPTKVMSENGRLRSYVLVTPTGSRDTMGLVEELQRVVAEKVQFPAGVHLEWSGEFEHQLRAARTLRVVFPAVILLIFLILYLTYKDFMDAGLMMLAVPEALAGGVFFQFLFPKILHGWDTPPQIFSNPVWIGYIAAFGMATETGIIMLVYLREAIEKRGGLAGIKSLAELRQAVIEGAVHRLRPKLLTEGVAIIALAPMLFSKGVGSEIYSAMALPVLGGLLIADEVVDIFLPVRFYWVRRARWLKLHREAAA
jgi:Cu/Ag efflux pump CusA